MVTNPGRRLTSPEQNAVEIHKNIQRQNMNLQGSLEKNSRNVTELGHHNYNKKVLSEVV